MLPFFDQIKNVRRINVTNSSFKIFVIMSQCFFQSTSKFWVLVCAISLVSFPYHEGVHIINLIARNTINTIRELLITKLTFMCKDIKVTSKLQKGT